MVFSAARNIYKLWDKSKKFEEGKRATLCQPVLWVEMRVVDPRQEAQGILPSTELL